MEALGYEGADKKTLNRRRKATVSNALITITKTKLCESPKTLAFGVLATLVAGLYGLAMRALWKRSQSDANRLLRIAQTASAQNKGGFQQLSGAMPQIAFTTQPDGNRDYVNSPWAEYIGAPLDKAFGKGWLNSVHADDKELVEEIWRRGLTTGEPIEFEYRVKYGRGDYRWHLGRALPVRDAAGVILRWVGTSTDIDDAKRLQQKLASDDKKKDEFIATLAHELRNPLAPIRNALTVMRLSTERSVREDSRNMIERQVEHLIRMVDDLFDRSRTAHGGLVLQSQRVELKSVLQDAIAGSQPRMQEQNHEFTAELPQDPVLVNCDSTRLAQLVSNLLNNAARYTPDGGKITLTAVCEGNELVIVVRDNGVGIPKEMLTSIFEMYTQGEQLGEDQGGMGIGLTLVDQIVKMHAGSVEVRSDGLGLGATFVVRLPIVVSERRRSIRTNEPSPGKAENGMRVLVVDDNADSVASLSMMLELMGHKTAIACSGAEALAAADAFRPDIVFSDIGMPEMDGYELARAIRLRPWGDDIRLIALSGSGESDDTHRSLEAGFNEHLVKPLEEAGIERLLLHSRGSVTGMGQAAMSGPTQGVD